MPPYNRPRFVIGAFAKASDLVACVSALVARGADRLSLYVLAGTAATKLECEALLQGQLSIGVIGTEIADVANRCSWHAHHFAEWLAESAFAVMDQCLASGGLVLFALADDSDQQTAAFAEMRSRVVSSIAVQDFPAASRDRY